MRSDVDFLVIPIVHHVVEVILIKADKYSFRTNRGVLGGSQFFPDESEGLTAEYLDVRYSWLSKVPDFERGFKLRYGFGYTSIGEKHRRSTGKIPKVLRKVGLEHETPGLGDDGPVSPLCNSILLRSMSSGKVKLNTQAFQFSSEEFIQKFSTSIHRELFELVSSLSLTYGDVFFEDSIDFFLSTGHQTVDVSVA